jgi:sulfite reductase (ferredoxin)
MTSSHTVAIRPAVKAEPIPPHIVEEIETFEAEADRVLAGDLSTDIFKPFRLQYGIYGQRQPGVQMFRIKIPFGGLTANQVRRVAELADRFATGVGARDNTPRHSAAFRGAQACAGDDAIAGRCGPDDP